MCDLERQSMIDINKQYFYRNGDPARILCTDLFGRFPIATSTKLGTVFTHDNNGFIHVEKQEFDYDLMIGDDNETI